MNIKIKNFISTRYGIISILVFALWVKTIIAYFTEFSLGVNGSLQYFILLINPIASAIILLSLGLYTNRRRVSYFIIYFMYLVMSILLFANVVYYREFTDFITINTMLGFSSISTGFGETALELFYPSDIIYIIDLIIFPFVLFKRKNDTRVKPRNAIAMTIVGVFFFLGNLSLAEMSRPGLLTRTFSRDYLVKYLGVNMFTAYDGVKTYDTLQVRAQASENDITEVEDYLDNNYKNPNDELFGLAEGKNVIYIHLESVQQFLIGYKLTDENGAEHEVMPFVNSLFHNESTFSFNNVFHQVSAGKTSDAETIMDNSLFGLGQGALFTQLGSKNTFESAPRILKDKGYTSAVFHGNSGNFWNRNQTYKRFGYDYFFDSSFYNVTEENSFQYGLHDKPFFEESQKYMDELPQPFYAKMIAVSNHYPYSKIEGNEFPFANTSDETINGYFATAHYLDEAVKEFFDYLKASGLYENSMIVLYGDHYGISNSRNRELAELVGVDRNDWDNFNNAKMQRVPLLLHIPGVTNGFVSDTYGGQIDVLPTVLHLLGHDTKNNLLLGQDLFTKESTDEVVAFRNGDWVSKDYTSTNGVIYDKEGSKLYQLTEEELLSTTKLKEKVLTQLDISDKINNGDLIRFYSRSKVSHAIDENLNYLRGYEKLVTDEDESN